jgi:hypothetical protein
MENNVIIKRYRIPQDVLMDTLRILFRNQLNHKIEGIKERENIIILQVYFTDTERNVKAEENIEEILKEYSSYMKDFLNDRTLFMDEEEDC